MSKDAPEKRLSTGLVTAYGQMVVPLAMMGLPIAVYLPSFYGDTLGLNLALVGVVLMVARLTDVVTDPIIGRLSDITHTRWGRRRPWVLVGVPITMIGSWVLFVPPAEVSALYLFGALALVYLGYTFITIPYGAWGAELSGDYHQRSRITGSREIFQQLGLLLAISAPVVVGIMAGAEDTNGTVTREAMAVLGWLAVLLLPVCAIILFAFVREPESDRLPAVPVMKGMRIAMSNGPFRIVLASSLVGALAGSINVTVALLFFRYVAELADGGRLLIVVLFFFALVGAPFWVRLSANISKHKGIVVAGLVSLAVFALVPVIIYVVKPAAPELVYPLFLAMVAIQGFASGATAVLGASMLADVVDLDTIKSGEQRAAFLFAFLGMANKLVAAAGPGIALPFLGLVGFDPPNGTDEAGPLFWLLAMYCLVPLALWAISIAIVWQYPLTRERQQRLRKGLERRIARKQAKRSES